MELHDWVLNRSSIYFSYQVFSLTEGIKFSDVPSIQQFAEEKLEKWPHCAHIYSTLIEIYREKGDKELLIKAIEVIFSFKKNL